MCGTEKEKFLVSQQGGYNRMGSGIIRADQGTLEARKNGRNGWHLLLPLGLLNAPFVSWTCTNYRPDASPRRSSGILEIYRKIKENVFC